MHLISISSFFLCVCVCAVFLKFAENSVGTGTQTTEAHTGAARRQTGDEVRREVGERKEGGSLGDVRLEVFLRLPSAL